MDKVEIELRKDAVKSAAAQLRRAENTACYFPGEAWAKVKADIAHSVFLNRLDELTELFEDDGTCDGTPCFSATEHHDDCEHAPIQVGNYNTQVNTFGIDR